MKLSSYRFVCSDCLQLKRRIRTSVLSAHKRLLVPVGSGLRPYHIVLSSDFGAFSSSRLPACRSYLITSGRFLGPLLPILSRRYQSHAVPIRSSNISVSLSEMVAIKIDGTTIAKNIRQRLKQDVQKLQEEDNNIKPSLTIIQGAPIANISPSNQVASY